MVDLDTYLEVIADRPKKLNAQQVGYERAPNGSAFRCSGCLHYFRRAIDNFAVCEIFRDDETDRNGVQPDWRCRFWTVDLDVYPLQPEDEMPPSEESLSEA